MTKSYKIVVGNKESFEKELKVLAPDNWEFLGEMQVTKEGDEFIYHQLLTKKEYAEPKVRSI